VTCGAVAHDRYEPAALAKLSEEIVRADLDRPVDDDDIEGRFLRTAAIERALHDFGIGHANARKVLLGGLLDLAVLFETHDMSGET